MLVGRSGCSHLVLAVERHQSRVTGNWFRYVKTFRMGDESFVRRPVPLPYEETEAFINYGCLIRRGQIVHDPYERPQ